jgi:hypothetical protein
LPPPGSVLVVSAAVVVVVVVVVVVGCRTGLGSDNPALAVFAVAG